MNKHFTTLCSRTINPITNRFELGFKSVNTVVADTFDVKDLDTTLTFFNPKRAVTSRSFTGDELTRRRHVVCIGVLGRGGGMKRWRNESALANGENMRDTKYMKHVHIRSMIPRKPDYER